MLYDYECTSCHEEFEAMCPSMALRDEYEPVCPFCGQVAKRVFNKKGPAKHLSWGLWNDHARVG